jgi:hypothetical protein
MYKENEANNILGERGLDNLVTYGGEKKFE